MKNIHVLPTDKPSRIIKSQDNDFILLNTNVPNWFEINLNTTKQNIYITSDEEIKDGDWYLTNKNTLCKCIRTDNKYVYSLEGGSSTNCKKIILTTDQDLIKDGVQPIPDEFLEWFVKNPSCEWVEVEDVYKKFLYGDKRSVSNFRNKYKIIIPKEEPKQEFLKQKRMSGAKTVSRILEEPKQETLEEVAEKYAELSYYGDEVDAFVRGAKWQAERMYSEEEVLAMLLIKHDGLSPEYVLEQFKKK